MLFVLDRRTEVERAVKPGRVVPVEPSEYLRARFGSSCKMLAVDDLSFEAGEETRPSRWTTPSTAPDPDGPSRVVRVTHPFHPWTGENFEFVVRRRTWHQDRVFFFLADGTLTSVPTAWTDVAEPDPFVALRVELGRVNN